MTNEITYIDNNYKSLLSEDEKKYLTERINNNLNIISICKCKLKDYLAFEYSYYEYAACSIWEEYNHDRKSKRFESEDDVIELLDKFLYNDVIIEYYGQFFSPLNLIYYISRNIFSNGIIDNIGLITIAGYTIDNNAYYKIIDFNTDYLLLDGIDLNIFSGVHTDILKLSRLSENINEKDNLDKVIDVILGEPKPISQHPFKRKTVKEFVNISEITENNENDKPIYLTDKMICRLDGKLFEYNDLRNFFSSYR